MCHTAPLLWAGARRAGALHGPVHGDVRLQHHADGTPAVLGGKMAEARTGFRWIRRALEGCCGLRRDVEGCRRMWRVLPSTSPNIRGPLHPSSFCFWGDPNALLHRCTVHGPRNDTVFGGNALGTSY